MLKLLPSATMAAALIAAPAFAQDLPEEIGTAVEAADSAGVIEALVSGGPVTVFVPTNDAVSSAPEDALNDLLGDSERLAEFIQGYAAVGMLKSADAMELTSDGTASLDGVGGGTLTIAQQDGTLMVGPSEDAMVAVVTPDLEFGNITVHVIDGVFLPE